MLETDSVSFHVHALEALTTAVLWLDPELKLRYLNPAAETLLELDVHKSAARPLAECLPAARELLHLLGRARESGDTLTQRELRVTLGSAGASRSVTVDCTVTPVAEREDAAEFLLELVPLDRHLRISREDAWSERSQANRALMRGLAHEIKNPLGGLRGAAQLLERKLPDPALQDYTRVIIREADRLAGLVDTLLGPPQAPRRESVNAHELLEHVIRLIESAAPAGIRIARDYDPSLPGIRVDRDQIIQALLNLAKNACEALNTRGLITFRTRTLRQFTLNGVRHRLVACLMIADNGSGIAPEIQARLFTPLTSSKPGGAGLGLTLAQELVTRHAGLIECASRPGETVFSILLPFESAHEQLRA